MQEGQKISSYSFNPMEIEGGSILTAYRKGGFQVNDHWFEGSIFVLPYYVCPWQGSLEDENFFEPIMEYIQTIDIVLLGLGSCVVPLSCSFEKNMASYDMSIDTMSTPAACRTYNVLRAERRRVMAALKVI